MDESWKLSQYKKGQGQGAARALLECRGNTQFRGWVLGGGRGQSPQSNEQLEQFSKMVASPGTKC